MLEILSLIIGGVLRLAPEALGLWKARKDADHEYRMTQLQLEVDKARAQQALDLAHAQAEIAANAGEMQAWADAIRGQAQPSGVGWVDAVSATVRPFLTYWWCLVLYTAAKAITVAVALQSNPRLADLVPILVTEFDRRVIGSMLAFWFVDRSLRRGLMK